MKKLFTILICNISFLPMVYSSTPAKVLRHARATTVITKEWNEKIGNEIVLKSEKVCEKSLVFDVVEFNIDPDFNFDPTFIVCKTEVNGRQYTLSVVPIIMETDHKIDGIPLLPENKRLKGMSGNLFASSVTPNEIFTQPTISNTFLTEDLNLKSSYIQLVPFFQKHSGSGSCSSTSCDKKDSSDMVPDAIFSAILKLEDFVD